MFSTISTNNTASKIAFSIVVVSAFSYAAPVAHVDVDIDISNISNISNNLIGGCIGTMYGCCKDNVTVCATTDCSNCANMTIKNNSISLIGGCIGTMYGCCKDKVTVCATTDCSNCANMTIY